MAWSPEQWRIDFKTYRISQVIIEIAQSKKQSLVRKAAKCATEIEVCPEMQAVAKMASLAKFRQGCRRNNKSE